LDQPECTKDLDLYDGVICDNTAQVRRVAFYSATPSYLFSGMNMNILKFDDAYVTAQPSTYEDDVVNFSSIKYKTKLDPSGSWTVPYVTGHKYKVHIGSGLNFENMRIELSERWEQADKDVYFVSNFSDVRASIEVKSNVDNY
jgi:hypothetical protein